MAVELKTPTGKKKAKKPEKEIAVTETIAKQREGEQPRPQGPLRRELLTRRALGTRLEGSNGREGLAVMCIHVTCCIIFGL